MKNFVLIGAAGYIAPRHMKAIRETGNNLLAALDRHDSVGVIDSYFPNAHFFTEFERFDRHVEKLKRQQTIIDYVVVCSPNYLHDAHIRFGFRIGANVVCEKPVVINPWNVDALLELENETGRQVFTILQLRHHPAILSLKERIHHNTRTPHTVQLRYVTPRGQWYGASWKGEEQKSGGIATNIGLHFFDILLWIFGAVKNLVVTEHSATKAAGTLMLEQANVEWMVSIDKNDLPAGTGPAFRSLTVDGEAVDFSDGFENLHTLSYQEILQGKGVSLTETRSGIQLVHDIRNYKIS